MSPDPSPPFRFRTPEWHDSLPSTNTYLRERQRRSPSPSGTVVAAVAQTAGRGRMGNAWFSPPGADLTFSFLWRGGIGLAAAGTFSLACGLAVADFLASLGLPPRCKWPNDILLAGAKVCGILCESVSPPGYVELVAGIGMNLAEDRERTARAGQPVASLESALGEPPTPRETLPRLLPFLEARVNQWIGAGFSAMAADYAAVMWGTGTRTRIRTGAGDLPVFGTLAGVGDDGRLLLRGDDGGKLEISSAVAIEPAPRRSGENPGAVPPESLYMP